MTPVRRALLDDEDSFHFAVFRNSMQGRQIVLTADSFSSAYYMRFSFSTTSSARHILLDDGGFFSFLAGIRHFMGGRKASLTGKLVLVFSLLQRFFFDYDVRGTILLDDGNFALGGISCFMEERQNVLTTYSF